MDIMALLGEVINDRIYTMFGYPPMMVVMMVLVVVELGVLLAFESGRKDRRMRDTPGWFDLPVALFFAWCIAAIYGHLHQDVSMGIIFWTFVWALAGFAMTVPILLFRAGLRKRRRQVSN